MSIRQSLGRFFLLVAFVSSVISCKKDSGTEPDEDQGGEYYISFKANGTEVKLESGLTAQISYQASENLHTCVLVGYKNFIEADKNHLGIVLWSNSQFAASTYTNAEVANKTSGGAVPRANATYLDADKLSYLALGVPVSEVPPFDKIISDMKVTITTLNNTTVAGTFSGTTYKTTDATFTATTQISEGKFNLKRSGN